MASATQSPATERTARPNLLASPCRSASMARQTANSPSDFGFFCQYCAVQSQIQDEAAAIWGLEVAPLGDVVQRAGAGRLVAGCPGCGNPTRQASGIRGLKCTHSDCSERLGTSFVNPHPCLVGLSQASLIEVPGFVAKVPGQIAGRLSSLSISGLLACPRGSACRPPIGGFVKLHAR